MILKSKNHVDILNLLSKCESMFQTNNRFDWRLEQYLKALFEMLDREIKKTGKLHDELVGARKKALFFRGLLEAHSKESLLEQYSAVNSLSLNSTINDDTDSAQVTKTKTIHLSEIANCEEKIRKELFDRNATRSNHHQNNNKLHSEKNFDDIVKYHQLLQDHVTNEMVELASSLKQNMAVSNEIVKKDTELLERTNRSTEGTVSNLKKNTEKIREFANMPCEYWLWIMLFVVTLTFLFMVIFIRLFPQRSVIHVVVKEKSEL